MWLVPQLTAFHQSQAEKRLAQYSCKIPLGNTLNNKGLRSVGYVLYNIATLFEASDWWEASICGKISIELPRDYLESSLGALILMARFL